MRYSGKEVCQHKLIFQQLTIQFGNRAKTVVNAEGTLTSKEGTNPENVVPHWRGRAESSPVGWMELVGTSTEYPGGRHLIWFLTSLEKKVKETEE